MLTEAVKKEENAAEAYRGLGMALYEQKEYKGALEAWGKCTCLQGIKESPQMYNLMGISAMQTVEIMRVRINILRQASRFLTSGRQRKQ